MKWKIIGNNKFIDNSNWIKEEENLLEWSENLTFIKQPLKYIAITFIYTVDDCLSGMLRTNIPIEPFNSSTSVLNKTIFCDAVNAAKTPKSLITNIDTDNGIDVLPTKQSSSSLRMNPNQWLENTYDYRDAAIYNIINKTDHIDHIDTDAPFVPIVSPYTCKSDIVVKIPNSIEVFHDLYEIVVIMQPASSIGSQSYMQNGLKSILRDGSKIGKTKKVHISDDSPKKYVYMKNQPVSNKRKTRRIMF